MIQDRKLDHINICLKEDIESSVGSGFSDMTLVHRAAPGLDMRGVNLETSFLGKTVSAPLMIAAMTGGHPKAKTINENLATAAQELGIPMGVGSQRAALKEKALKETYSCVRDVAPEAFIVGNLGAVQFMDDYGIEEAELAVEMIDADALAIHFNPLQEAVQPEGDLNFTNTNVLKELKGLGVPLIAKETGAGVAREEALIFEKLGFSAVDVGGLGGTSFSAVEHYREGGNMGETFRDWGIPTAASVVECKETTGLEIIATGGVRTGIDMAKAMSLGAIMCGTALPLLGPAMKSHEEVVKVVSRFLNELRVAMFLSGATDVKGLYNTDVIVTGRTREWLLARGFDHRIYANRRLK